MKANSASEALSSPYMRVLLLGAAKTGKTYTTLSTAPGHETGNIYLINSDDKYAAGSVAEDGHQFDFNPVFGDDPNKMQECITMLRAEVKAGKYQTIVWDTITKYQRRALEVYEDATKTSKGEIDGRRASPQLARHMHGVIDQLFSLNAHVIVNSHWQDEFSPEIEGQISKSGAGIAPNLHGQLRKSIPAEFQHVWFLQINHKDEREILTHIHGAWGVGGRSASKDKGLSSHPADISKVWEALNRKKVIT